MHSNFTFTKMACIISDSDNQEKNHFRFMPRFSSTRLKQTSNQCNGIVRLMMLKRPAWKLQSLPD